MKYKKYPQYKDSGVEWLGEIPKEWNISKIKHLFNLGRGRVIAVGELEDAGIYPVYSSQTKNNGILGLIKTYDYNCRQITWTTDGANAGTVFLREGKHNCTNVCGTLQARNDKDLLEYMTYSLQFSTQFYKRPDTNGAKIMNGEMAEIFTPRPPLQEQQIIASYLDKTTVKIDTLIQKQTKLIELLKEKRQAVISHAVTHGLDSSVPMKDSGVEWLGEIPENWILSKFGYLSIVVRGGSPRPAGDPTLFNGDYSPWVTVAEITKDIKAYITETETFLTKKGSEQCRVFSKGTLVLSNSGATLGVPKILSINANANDGVVGFENLSPKILIMYAYYYLFSLTENLRDRMNQGSGQPNLNTDIVKALQIPLPPIEVQGRLVEFIDNKISKIDTLTAKAKKAIYLLKEKRTALISAVVTGKIDVREES